MPGSRKRRSLRTYLSALAAAAMLVGSMPISGLAAPQPAALEALLETDAKELNVPEIGAAQIAATDIEAEAQIAGAHTFRAVETIAALGLTGAADTAITTWTDGFFTISSGRWRPGQGGGVFESNRNGDGAIEFTTDGVSNVVVTASSTGGANTSAITLWNEAGEAMTERDGVVTVFGTNPQTTLTFENLPAGTYRVVSNDTQEGGGHNRGVRIFAVTVTQDGGASMDVDAYPANLEAASGYDGLVRLSWTPVANAVRHEFRYRPQGSQAWSQWAAAQAASNHVVSPLVNGTTYEFQVRAHDGALASAVSPIVTATPTALAVLEIAGISAGASHDFGTVAHHYTLDDVAALVVEIRNTGNAPAENVAIALASGASAFVLTGDTGQDVLLPGETLTVEMVPALQLPSGMHSGQVAITAADLPLIHFNLSFNVLSQDMNAVWGEPAYIFDFSMLPTDSTQTGAGVIGSIPNRPISDRHDSIRTVAPHASQQDFELLIGIGTNANNGFRSVGTAPHNFIDPNGAGRLLGASHALSGPIRVELDVLTPGAAPRSQLTLYFGNQSVTFPVTGSATAPSTVVVEFASGEGLLRTSAFPWGPNAADDPIGRVGLQAVRIFEGEFAGPWIESLETDAISFANLPYGYTQMNVTTHYIDVTNVGSETTPIQAQVGEGFEITELSSDVLAAGERATIGIRPVTGLDAGLHEAALVISATADGNTLVVPVGVTVNEPLALPEGAELFYTGEAVSQTGQFPNDVDEDVEWAHGFRRISFEEGSPRIRFNGEVRDADTSLAIPFILNDVLWVPKAAAQLALPGTDWTVAGGYLTVAAGMSSYYGQALVATEELHGGDAIFVAVQEIADALNIGNIGWDERSQTLIVVTGTAVEQGNVLYGNINNRPEAWYGSPNSLAIATNFVYMQRANGGWPRGIGQINALPHQPDIAGMSPETVYTISLGFNNEDSYFGRGITTNETRFLLRMYEATGIDRFREAGLRGLDTILRTQDPLGGWPYQISGGSYHRALSISDHSITNILWLLMDMESDGIFENTIGEARMAQAIAALELGMDWILSSQVRSAAFADGEERLTAWAFASYQSAVAGFTNLQPGATPGIPGQPAWQREFEPPSISGNESVDIIRFLMSIPDPSPQIQEAIHAAVAFFDYVRIDGFRLNHASDLDPLLGRHIVPEEGARPLWPRFIDIETFEPLFYDRTGPFAATVSPHQNVNISTFESQHGQWQGYVSGFRSANATSSGTDASGVRAGTRRNLYRDEAGNLSTDSTGTFDLAASFHNLSFERRSGFNYMNHFAETLPQEYAAWLVREGISNEEEPAYVVQAIPSARVERDNGNTNRLYITLTEYFSDGTLLETKVQFVIRNNASGTFTIQTEAAEYAVFVNTQGNTQIREIHIVTP